MNRSSLLAGCLLATTASAGAAPEKAAVFDFQFSNLSPVPSDAADAARLKRTRAELRDVLFTPTLSPHNKRERRAIPVEKSGGGV